VLESKKDEKKRVRKSVGDISNGVHVVESGILIQHSGVVYLDGVDSKQACVPEKLRYQPAWSTVSADWYYLEEVSRVTDWSCSVRVLSASNVVGFSSKLESFIH